jgi:hypothetical protein
VPEVILSCLVDALGIVLQQSVQNNNLQCPQRIC